MLLMKKKTCQAEKKKGRPTRYSSECDQLAFTLCEYGADDNGLARAFSVSKQTITKWKQKHPSFVSSIKKAKVDFDTRVERALYERAIGYSHPHDEIFNDMGTPLIVPTTKHYPPDTAAAFIWLKNRLPERWRDKVQVEHEGTIKADPELISAAREVAAALVK